MARLGARKLACLAALGGLLGAPVAADLSDIQAAGVLKVCVAVIDTDLTTPPPPDCPTCPWSGLIPDQVRLFANALGVDVTFQEVGWAEQFQNDDGRIRPVTGQTPTLMRGTCDLYPSNLARLDWREALIDIVPLFQSRMIVLTHPDLADVIRATTDLGGHTVALEKHSSFHNWLLDLNRGVLADNPVLMSHQDGANGLSAVMEGRADFAVTDADMAVMAVRNRYPDLNVAFAAGPVQELGWGVAKESKNLRAAIEDFCAEQCPDPTSPLNQLWRSEVGLSIPDFEALVSALPGG